MLGDLDQLHTAVLTKCTQADNGYNVECHSSIMYFYLKYKTNYSNSSKIY